MTHLQKLIGKIFKKYFFNILEIILFPINLEAREIFREHRLKFFSVETKFFNGHVIITLIILIQYGVMIKWYLLGESLFLIHFGLGTCVFYKLELETQIMQTFFKSLFNAYWFYSKRVYSLTFLFFALKKFLFAMFVFQYFAEIFLVWAWVIIYLLLNISTATLGIYLNTLFAYIIFKNIK